MYDTLLISQTIQISSAFKILFNNASIQSLQSSSSSIRLLHNCGNSNYCYFRAPQLHFECPQTLEQPTTATPRFDTDT